MFSLLVFFLFYYAGSLSGLILNIFLSIFFYLSLDVTLLVLFKNNISVGGGVIAFLGRLPPSNVFITSLRFAPSTTTRSGAVQIDPLPSSCAARLKKK